MSYPWFVFTVWFADGWDGVYQATGLTVTEAIRELMDGFEANPDVACDIRMHGNIVKIQFEEQYTQRMDAVHAAQAALEMAKGMQTDINRILKKE